MKQLISALWLVSNLAMGTAWAQPYAPNEAGVTMGHWHLNSTRCRGQQEDLRRHGRHACQRRRLRHRAFPGVS